MDNLEFGSMTENEIIEYYQPFIRKIIKKHFRNHVEFTKLHMISFEELEQFGMIGVMEGLRTFDETKGTKLSTHLFARIISAVNRNAKKASLRNKNNYSFDLVNTVSLNSHIEVGDGISEEWLNVLPIHTNDCETNNDELVIEQAIKQLIADKSIQKDYVAFLVCRLNGDSVLKISKKFEISSYHVQSILKKFETKTSVILQVGV